MNRSGQSGFSILSLLIAVSIGVFMMAAVGKAYVTSKQAFNARAAFSAAAENGRFALADMRSVLLMTGRNIEVDDEDSNGKLLYEEPVGDFNAGIADGTNDAVAVWYAAGKDCHGAAITTPTLSQFSVSNGELQCTVGNTTRTLVSGIESMQILYGIDTTVGGDNYANRYYTATQLNAIKGSTDSDIWKKLVSIRIGIIASSEGAPSLGIDSANAATYAVLDQTHTPSDASKVYRSFGATVSLRNMNAVNR